MIKGFQPWIIKPVVAIPAALCVASVCATAASAHVKWFCAYDVAGQPQGLENVLCPDFEQLTALALVVLLVGCLLNGTPVGIALLRALDRVTASVRDREDILVRATSGFFFVAVWTTGGIILTPELFTSSPIVPWIHLTIAVCLIWRRTLPVSALGIVVLYAIALYDYGLFHLMDYPIFLGVAVYLALTGWRRSLFGIRPLDVVRWAAGITLMWASIEKWAYPEWTYPLFITHPAMSMGFDVDFYMRAAGVVEFTLAFAIVWTPLVRRCAAIILAGVFLSAVAEFGRIDAIGHSVIVVVLMIIAADNHGTETRRFAWWRSAMLTPISYGAALASFLTLYYVVHAALFSTTII